MYTFLWGKLGQIAQVSPRHHLHETVSSKNVSLVEIFHKGH